MYKVSLGQYLGQNFMNRSFHNASLIFFATVSNDHSMYFNIEIHWCALENQQSPFYVVNRDSLSQDYIP